MNRWLGSVLALLLLLLPALADAQSIVRQGSITTNGQIVSLQALNAGSGTIQITGTWTGTIIPVECSIDGATFASIPVAPVAGGAAVTTTTANGMWTFSGAFVSCRARATAAMTGTAVINLLVTNARVPSTLSMLGAVGGSTINTVTLTGTTTATGNIVLSSNGTGIRSDTADGSDTKSAFITGGGSGAATRGAFIQLFGNEHGALPGQLYLDAGQASGAHIFFRTGAASTTTRFTITETGALRAAPFAFAALATVLTSNGDFGYCSDCTIANPCAGAGTGAFAKRLNGVHVCN